MSYLVQWAVIVVSIVLMLIPIITSASLKEKEKEEFLKDLN